MGRLCEGAMDEQKGDGFTAALSHEKAKENTHESTKESQEKIPQNPNKESQESSDDSHESNLQDSQKHLQESSKGSEETVRESGKEYQQEPGNSLYWGILEELLLACLVRKHGTHDWTLVTAGLDAQLRRRGQNQSFTAEACRAQFDAIKSRYTTEEDSVEDRAPDDMPWLEELLHLWKAELRRQIVRHDSAIEIRQNEIIRLQSLRGGNSTLACMQEYPNVPAASQLDSGARVEYSSDAHAPLQHRSDIAWLPDSTRGSSTKDNDEVVAKEVEEVVATVANSLGNVATSPARLGSLPISVQEGALEHDDDDDDGTSVCVKAPFDALDCKEQPNSAIQWTLEHDDSGIPVCVKAPSDALHAKEPPNSIKNEVTDLRLQEDDTQKTGQETSGNKPEIKVAFISEDDMPKRRPVKKKGKSTRKTWKPFIKDVKEERDATNYLKSIIDSSVKTKLITSHGVNENMQALRVKEDTAYITEESHQMERRSLDSGVVKSEDVSFVIAGKEDMDPTSTGGKKTTRVPRKPNPPLVECLRTISKHSCAAIFQRTRESQDNARYASLIRDPVDISKVRARLEEGQYLGSLHFFRDLLLMVTNASVYYGVNAPEFKAASGLRECIKEEMKVVFEREDLRRDCRRRVSKAASLIKPSTQSHVSVQVEVLDDDDDDDDDDAGNGTPSAKLAPSCRFVYRKGDLKARRCLARLPNKGEESSGTVTHAAPVHQPDVVAQEPTQRGEGGRPQMISQQQQTPQKLRKSEAAPPPRRKRVRR